MTAGWILKKHEVSSEVDGPTLIVRDASAVELAGISQLIVSGARPDALALARDIGEFRVDKWDWVLDDEL